MKDLYASLGQRRRPEDVAQKILELLRGRLNPVQQTQLERAAHGSLKRQVFAYTSMAQDFARPVGAQRQVAKVEELFGSGSRLHPDQCDDPEAVTEFLQQIGPQIRKAFGANSFKENRLNAEQRAAAGLDISRRAYNKRFRLLARTEAKVQTLVREILKARLTKIGKSSLASELSWEDFASDPNSACFVAYYAARSNLRSEFTVAGQQRAFDEIAEMLLARCRESKSANWRAIAHVYPSGEVLERLTDTEKVELLGRWLAVLRAASGLLKRAWDGSDINRRTMIVKRGNDSTTWNNTASAFNKARDQWLALVCALGMENLLETICPGKALRLMAADVAAWHRFEGHTLEPDTAVWNELPLPWEALAGETVCTRAQIEDACRRNGVNPEKSGWTAPRPRTSVAAFRPTPELVHGVTVADPFLATLLRKAGYFSGQPKSAMIRPENPLKN